MEESNTIVDISVVMNVHRSSKYYHRTILSLEEAVQYARHQGITIELIVVMDAPDDPTVKYFSAYQPILFNRIKILTVNNRALGVSRNDGIRQSIGRYVMTFDDDDLVSFNYIATLFETAEQEKIDVIVYPEYLYGFGDGFQLCKYFAFPALSRLIFIESHALMSRFLASRNIFDKIEYNKVKIGDALGYEDWHFSCEAIASKIKIYIATDTVLFYRERRTGSAWTMASQSVGQIPQSSLFTPKVYLDVCSADYKKYKDSQHITTPTPAILSSFLGNFVVGEALTEAAEIEPSLRCRPLETFAVHCNKDRYAGTGVAYYEICDRVKNIQFDDVIILPFLTTDDKGNMVRQLLDKLLNKNVGRTVLIVSGHGGFANDEAMNLPDRAIFIDMYNTFDNLSYERIFTIVFKLIQSCGSGSAIHLFACKFSCDFFKLYYRALRQHLITFYYPSVYADVGRAIEINFGSVFSFIDSYSDQVNRVVTDDPSMKEALANSCGLKI